METKWHTPSPKREPKSRSLLSILLNKFIRKKKNHENNNDGFILPIRFISILKSLFNH